MRDLPPGSPHAEDVIEPFVTLASLIHMISRPHLGVSTLVLTRRNAIIVAKQTTALDLLSQGRLILGVVGHREEEFAFLGADYAHRGPAYFVPVALRHVLPAEDHALWARLAEPTERALVRRPGLRLLRGARRGGRPSGVGRCGIGRWRISLATERGWGRWGQQRRPARSANRAS